MSDDDRLLAQKQRLTRQLMQVDEAVDTASGVRKAEKYDLPWRVVNGEETIEVEIKGDWYTADDAVEMTRAALFTVDQSLEDAGLLPKGDA